MDEVRDVLLTSGDAQARADSIQRSSVALAGNSAQSMLSGPLTADMVRRLEGRLPIHPGATAQGGSCQYVHACRHFLLSPAT